MNFAKTLILKIFQYLSSLFNISQVKSYSGNYKNGLYSGKGRLEFKDGSVYEGQFENNKMHGFGKIFFKDGSIYQGNFKNNLRDGTGLSRKKDGSQQRVVYQKGKFKDVFTEDYTIHWKNTVEGTFEIRAADCSKAMDVFKSLTKEELLQKSQLNADLKKMKVTDMSVFVEEELYNWENLADLQKQKY